MYIFLEGSEIFKSTTKILIRYTNHKLLDVEN